MSRNNFLLVAVSLMEFCMVCGQNNSTSQGLYSIPEIIQPSPTVAGLMKIEETSVNYYTGQPNIGVPLFSKRINGFNYQLGLSYQSSGIREIEHSGWVGTGWSLESGAVISRTVMDLPDEINKNGSSGTAMRGIFHNDFFDFFDLDFDPSQQGYNDLIIGSDTYKYNKFLYDAQWARFTKFDSQRDIYQFNIFGRTGRFVFVKDFIDGNFQIVPKIIGEHQSLKIIPNFVNASNSLNYSRVIQDFDIIDESGNRYKFDVVEYTTMTNLNIIDYHRIGTGSVLPGQNVIPAFPSAWKLSSIRSSNGGEFLNILYQDVDERPVVETNKVTSDLDWENWQIANSMVLNDGSDCRENILFSSMMPRTFVNRQYKTISSKKIDSIIFRDGTFLKFEIDLLHPEYQGARLNAIKIYKNRNELQYDFSFNYISDLDNELLFLESVDKISDNNSYKYDFEYNTPDALNKYTEKKTDDFGYHHSNNSLYRTSIISGSLKSISYPTGVRRVFNWEPNTYSFVGSDLLSFNEIFKNPDNYDVQRSYLTYIEGNSTQNNQQTFEIDIDQEVTVSYAFQEISDAGSAPGSGSQTEIEYMLNCIPIISDVNLNIDNQRDTNSLLYHQGYDGSGINKVFLKKGWYKLGNSVNLTSPNLPNDTLNIQIEGKKLKEGNLNWFAYGGGVRINSINEYQEQELLHRKLFKYGLETIQDLPDDHPEGISTGHNYSSGSFDGIRGLTKHYKKKIRPLVGLINTIISPIEYQVTEYMDASQAQLTQGSYVGYKNVVVYNRNTDIDPTDNTSITSGVLRSLDIGYTKYEYDSPIDFPSYPWYYEEASYPFEEVPSNEYLKGHLRTEGIYDNQDKIMKETEYSYVHDSIDTRKIIAQKIDFILDENKLVEENLFLDYDHPQWSRSFYQDFDHYFSRSNPVGGFGSCVFNGAGISSTDILSTANPGYIVTGLSSEAAQIIDIYNYRTQVKSIVTNEYFYSGDGSQSSTQNSLNYSYNQKNYLPSRTIQTNSKGETLTTKTFYTVDSNSLPDIFDLGERSLLSEMIGLNQLTVPILKETFHNNKLTSRVKYNYNNYGLNNYQINTTSSQKSETDPREPRLTYHRYDAYGNPLELSKADGTHISYFYGHGGTLPIAKIEGLTYQEIANILTGGNINTLLDYDENNMSGPSGLNSLRNSSTPSNPFMVTTLEYEVGVGIEKVTDPRGRETTYEYDEFHRLKHVKDHEENILSENEYKYATQD
ncbi:MAG: RHS repeat domain-containing protein [Nonlabens sp.]